MHNTDYTTFALMSSRRRSGSQSILRVHLLCEPLPSSLRRRWGGREEAQGSRVWGHAGGNVQHTGHPSC